MFMKSFHRTQLIHNFLCMTHFSWLYTIVYGHAKNFSWLYTTFSYHAQLFMDPIHNVHTHDQMLCIYTQLSCMYTQQTVVEVGSAVPRTSVPVHYVAGWCGIRTLSLAAGRRNELCHWLTQPWNQFYRIWILGPLPIG